MVNTLALVVHVLVLMTASGTPQECYEVVEKGKSDTFTCSFNNGKVTTITWRMLNGTTTNDLTTCNFITNTCTDLYAPADYKGYIVPPASGKTMILNITSAKENEVEFYCVSDTGLVRPPCDLVVYETSSIVEKGQPTTLQCAVPSNAASITWQLFKSGTFINVSTCTVVNKVCVDNQPASYKGTFSSSGNENKLSLNVTRASITETVFRCLTDKGDKSSNFGLEVYIWPSKPRCTQSTISPVGSSIYIQYNCTTDNVYPLINASLTRRVTAFIKTDFDPLTKGCVGGGNGTEGGHAVSCQWRTPINKVRYGLGVYVEMSATVSNLSLVNRIAAFSDDIIPSLTIPEVRISNCPVGPGVVENVIRIGTTAQCTCELTRQGVPPGTAQWRRTFNGKSIGVPTTCGSSILMLSYNASDRSPTYYCVPIPPFIATFTYYNKTFTFASSAPPSGITGLQALVIALGVLSSLITSYFP